MYDEEEFDVDDDGASYKSVGTAGSRRSRGPEKEKSDARGSATGGQAGGSTSVGRSNAGTNTGVITGSHDTLRWAVGTQLGGF